MGRKLRRVPLDFDWPQGKVWQGYLNPLYKPCPAAVENMCHGGYTNAAKWLSSICRLIALIGEQAVQEPFAEQLRLRGQVYPHPYLENWEQAPRIDPPHELRERMRENKNAYRMLQDWHRSLPTTLVGFGGDEMIAFVTALAEEVPHPMQGSNYGWAIEKTLRAAAKLTEGWGVCKVCNGHSIDPEVREAFEAWEQVEPPTGDGWQLWETTSEGSPMSPVFATRDELIDWCVGNATTFGSFKASREEWSKMLDEENVYHREGNMIFM